MKKDTNAVEMVVRLVDGRLKYGIILESENDQTDYSFVATNYYQDYLQSNNQELVEHLPLNWVTSIQKH